MGVRWIAIMLLRRGDNQLYLLAKSIWDESGAEFRGVSRR